MKIIMTQRIMFFLSVFFALSLASFFTFSTDAIKNIALIMMGISFVLLTIIRMLFWKCPSCNTFLPIREGLTFKHCPYCGTQLSL